MTLTDRQTDGRRNKYTHFAWAGGTFFPVVLLCCVSFLFWREKGFDLHTHVLPRVQYSCGGVLVFWFWREIVLGVTHILSVQLRFGGNWFHIIFRRIVFEAAQIWWELVPHYFSKGLFWRQLRNGGNWFHIIFRRIVLEAAQTDCLGINFF